MASYSADSERPGVALDEPAAATGSADEVVEPMERNINSLPDELLLMIFQQLENQDIAVSVSNVCQKWMELASDEVLWRNRFIFYCADRNNAFAACVGTAKGQIRHLHLDGHETLEDTALHALLRSNVTSVKRLSFLGSCRTNPDKVMKILKKFATNLESLTLCLNDELVSYGEDERTCYALTHSNVRPGLLFSLIGCMKNLRNLTLFGGFSTEWYFGELLQLPGCNKVESLNFKDFEVFCDHFESSREFDFIQTLIIKNKDHLRSLKLSIPCAASPGIRRCVQECHQLKELSVNIEQLNSFLNKSLTLTSLQLSGRFIHNRQHAAVACIINYKERVQELTELNFIQFDNIGENIFHSMGNLFHHLKVLRMDGNMLTTENIRVIASHFQLLDQICVRSSEIVAEKHFIYLHLEILNLLRIDFDEMFELNCTNSAEELKKVPFGSFKVISTGCNCYQYARNHKTDEISQDLSSEAVLSRSLHLTFSNNLDNEFLPKFGNFNENDINFHFNQ